MTIEVNLLYHSCLTIYYLRIGKFNLRDANNTSVIEMNKYEPTSPCRKQKSAGLCQQLKEDEVNFFSIFPCVHKHFYYFCRAYSEKWNKNMKPYLSSFVRFLDFLLAIVMVDGGLLIWRLDWLKCNFSQRFTEK